MNLPENSGDPGRLLPSVAKMIPQSFASKQFFFLAMAATSLAQPGFISIDCVLKQSTNYTELSGIIYSPDFGYVDGGVNADVSNVPDLPEDMYRTMRTFPNGTRNCYTVGPVTQGATYLVRASFFYGNYDGQNNAPTFDLHLGVNFWTTVETHEDETEFAEIITTALYHAFDVCLVKTGFGTPFISVLEVRPVNNSVYEIVDSSRALVVREGRVDYGGNQITRYPDDAYDRFWFPSENKTGWTVVRTDKEIVREGNPTATVPLPVLKTAIVYDDFVYYVTVSADEKIVQFLYFAELEELPANETRGISVIQNGEVVYKFYSPRYLTAGKLRQVNTGIETTGSYKLKSTSNSTRPPLINARELYGLKRLETTLTDAQDRDAMLKIKQAYGVRKNWQGDPCLPREFSWEGVGCLYDASANIKIVSLNLSGSGLTGGISPSIVTLTALTSLDLSNNRLGGNIPEVLANLQNLEVLNLAKNGLNGSLPDVFYKKSISGALTLNIDGNAELCKNVDLCRALNIESTEIREKRKLTVAIAVGVSLCVTLLVGAGILIWWVKERKSRTDQSALQENLRDDTSSSNSLRPQFNLQSPKFSFSDITFITKNFGRLIGKGGFATVYHGSLNDGTEVAVKLLSKTSRRRKDFHAEEQILTRVHHKNLVRLLGYCDDQDNLALVYEYMRKGSLAEHLWREGEDNIQLDWNMRLRVAVDVAQGLDYLHKFCKPPIIHRDIKTRNILLDEHFEAKLGDFGLSKLFSNDNDPPMTTVVAGTPGYLDPEYYQTSTLTEKSDVYSFGIVLLEIITGQAPTDNDAREGPLLLWVKSKLERGDIESIVDRRLIGGYNPNSMWKALEVAIKCSSSSSVHRPQMSEVVSELKECLESEASSDKSDQLSIQMPKPDVSLVIPTAR